MTYGTTPAFLEYFGLRSLEDLPAADELRRIVVQKPESLVTVDPGLATAPPEQLTLPTEPVAPRDEGAGRQPPSESDAAAGETLEKPAETRHSEQPSSHGGGGEAGRAESEA
jgi:hypothetical protein